jgi:hypothetical protein
LKNPGITALKNDGIGRAGKLQLNAGGAWQAQKKSLPDIRKALSVIYCSFVSLSEQ